MNYTCAKCDPTEPHPDVDFCPKCDKQSARIRELEGALRDLLAHVATIRNNLPMRDTRESHEFIMESWSAARRILAEGSVKP